MMPHFIKVDLHCNNEQGLFTGKLDGITFGNWDKENIISSQFDNDFDAVNIKFKDNCMFLGNLKIKLLRHYTSRASWCFDTIEISENDLVRLLNHLRKKDFIVYEGSDLFYNKFNDKEKKEILLNDIRGL